MSVYRNFHLYRLLLRSPDVHSSTITSLGVAANKNFYNKYEKFETIPKILSNILILYSSQYIE